MGSAIAIGHYMLNHAMAAYALMGADELMRLAKHVLRQLQKHEKCEEIKRHELFRLSRNPKIKKPDDIAPIVDILVCYDYLRESTPNDSGNVGRKPDKRYMVNPAIWDTSL